MAHAGKETATTIEPHPASGSVASPAIAAGRIRVLLVEPRRIYADMLARTLRAEEFAVDVARSHAAALTAVRDDDPDVVVVCLGSSAHGAVVLDRVRQAAQCGVVALADTEVAPLVSRVGVVPIGSVWPAEPLPGADKAFGGRSCGESVRSGLDNPYEVGCHPGGTHR